MQQPIQNYQTSAAKSFWQRQFQASPTKNQKIFDWFFGVALPVLCFAFDPFIFKNGGYSGPLLGDYKPFAYLLSFVSVMAMAAWLVWGARLKWLSAFLAGLFVTGAGVSLTIGVFLFPFSLLGLLLLIGALGFTPLFAALVFLRNGRRALRTAKSLLGEKLAVRIFLLAVVFSAVVPYAINAEIKKITDTMKKGDLATIRRAAENLKYVAPIANTEVLKRHFYSDSAIKNADERNEIAEIYRRLTGRGPHDGSFSIFD